MVQELLLEIKDLEVNFHTYRGIVKALNGVNLKINKGEFLVWLEKPVAGRV